MTRPLAANIGWMRPPMIYLLWILTGGLLERVWPMSMFADHADAHAGRHVGEGLALCALVLVWFSVRRLRDAGTPVRGSCPTTAIVKRGPYRHSRNPIYLAFTMLHIGVALWVNTVWLLATLIPALSLMTFVVIPREERYLEERFGEAYLSYKDFVPRWL